MWSFLPVVENKKRRGGFHIRPCPFAAEHTSAGAYRMRPYGFRLRPKGENSAQGTALSWPPLRGGSARRRWGRELYGCPKYFGLWQGSLPPPLRGTAPPLAQAPPPPYRGSLSRRGRFFDTLRATHGRPYISKKASMQFFDGLKIIL